VFFDLDIRNIYYIASIKIQKKERKKERKKEKRTGEELHLRN
jgi:hypothetical protein